jgi:hypothetical protein
MGGGIMILILRAMLIMFAVIGGGIIVLAEPSEKNEKSSMITMGVFFDRASVLFMYAGEDVNPDGVYSYRWLRDGKEILRHKSNMLNISINELLGEVGEEIKGCVTISYAHKNSEPERCVTYFQKILPGNGMPPEATLFTYRYPSYTLNAKYYYHSSFDVPEGVSKFAWVIKKQNGFLGLIKSCMPNEECSLQLTNNMKKETIGVFIQPVDKQGTIGRGDIKWYFIDGHMNVVDG